MIRYAYREILTNFTPATIVMNMKIADDLSHCVLLDGKFNNFNFPTLPHGQSTGLFTQDVSVPEKTKQTPSQLISAELAPRT